MESQNLESVMDVMCCMVDAEKTVSAFYQACAERFTENEVFWKELAREESVHAEMLCRIMRTVKRRPEQFQIGNVSPLSVVSSFILRVNDDLHKVHNHQLDEDGAIFRAFHMESVLIEERYMEAVQTENKAYLRVLNQLRSAEVEHKTKIAKRMKQHKSYESPEAACATHDQNSEPE